ncbi:MAG: hypothetical protein AAGG47_10075 [Pseudomonadota bacterium]
MALDALADRPDGWTVDHNEGAVRDGGQAVGTSKNATPSCEKPSDRAPARVPDTLISVATTSAEISLPTTPPASTSKAWRPGLRT